MCVCVKCSRLLIYIVGKYSRYGGSARRVPRRGQGVHGAAKGTLIYRRLFTQTTRFTHFTHVPLLEIRSTEREKLDRVAIKYDRSYV